MIAAYRRFPLFISNNVRTLFCDTAKLAHKRREQWPQDWLKDVKTGRTNTSKYKYQLLQARDNVRVLLINNPKIKDKITNYCAIRIGVGSEDDPDTIRGMAHLLEHTLCHMNWGISEFYAVTHAYFTVYSFTFQQKNELENWLKILFSTDQLEIIITNSRSVVVTQRDLIDSEFHEKRSTFGSNVQKVVEIAKVFGLNVAKFNYGNKNTLSEIGDGDANKNITSLMNELNALRAIYRQRPMNLCIYSAKKQDMESILNSLNVEHFLEKEKAEAARLAKTSQKQH